MGVAGTTEEADAHRRTHSSRQDYLSLRGRDAVFGEPADEVERILKVQKNYYAVLKVRKNTPAPEVRQNYFRVSRLVHPDKCSHPQAKDASAVVNQAYDTLNSSVKKALYDRYVEDTGDLDAPDGVSYADWEAQNSVNIHVPAWMEPILRVPGGAICLLILLLPLTLILVLLMCVAFLICWPVRCALGLCFGFQPPQQRQQQQRGDNEDDEPVVIIVPPDAAAAERPGDAPAAQAVKSKETEQGVSGSQQEASEPKQTGSYRPPPPV